jgi:RNA polymerase sigma-70 factor (ECF subfamily)
VPQEDEVSELAVSQLFGSPLMAASIDASAQRAAFARLYEQWFDHVSRWVRALGATEAEREDVTQDIFMVVHRRLADFDGQNAAGWLYQIARRKVRDHRRLSWIKDIFRNSTPLADSSLTSQVSPQDSLETKQKAQLFEALVSTLNQDQRAAFVLFEIEGSSGEEIARLQGVPINTVWARIHEARKSLQKRARQLEVRESQRAGLPPPQRVSARRSHDA